MGRGPFDEPPLRTPPPVRRIVAPLARTVPAALHDTEEGFDLLGAPAEELVDDPTTLQDSSEWTEEMIELDADLLEEPVEAVMVEDGAAGKDPSALLDEPAEEDAVVLDEPEERTTLLRPVPEPDVMPDDIGVGLVPADLEPPPPRPSLVIGRPRPAGPLVVARPVAPVPPPPPPKAEEFEDDDVADTGDDETPVDAEAPAVLRGSSPIVCQLALAIAAESVPCEAGAVLLATADVLVFVAATGPVAPKLVGRAMAQGIGVAGQTFRTGRTAHVAGPHPLPWPGDGLDRGTDFQVRSVLSVPIAHAGRVRGVLQLLNRSGQSAFTDEDAATLASVADVLGEDMKWATLDAELAPAVGR